MNQQDWPSALVFGDSYLLSVILQAPGKGVPSHPPMHFPKYLLYQPLEVWDCFPMDRVTMKDQK